MPRVSIIVPVYNAERYLHECIDSILAQTFSDFELILVDDGSPDRCPLICDSYAVQDSRVRVIHQKNQGQSAARNHGVQQAAGEWICFVDSDDLLHPQMLQYLYSAATESGLMISMCENQEAICPSEDFYQPCDGTFSTVTMDEDTWVSLYDAERYPCWVIWAKLISKDIILKYPFCEGRVYEDNAIVCHWFYEAGKIAWVSHQMYFYRENPAGTTKSQFSMKKLDYLWALEEIIRFCRMAEMPRLRERFYTRYLKMADAFRYQIQDYPEKNKVTEKIRRDTKAFLREENLVLTKEQKGLLLNVLIPGLADVRELADAGMQKIRDEGFLGFLRKTKNYLKRGGRA